VVRWVVLELFFGLLGAFALGRGAWLAFRSAPKASSWLAAAAVLGAGVALVRDQALQGDRRISLDVADDAVVRGLLGDIDEDLDRGQTGEGDAP